MQRLGQSQLLQHSGIQRAGPERQVEADDQLCRVKAMKVAVIGGNGQLGRDVASAFADEGHVVTSLTHQDVEVSSLASVHEALGVLNPELVVNTSAFHHVEKCETDPALAFAVNGIGARNLAQITQEKIGR